MNEYNGLVALGIASLSFFVFAALTVLFCGRDTNWQERRFKTDAIAYLANDDRWYPGVRINDPQDWFSLPFWRGKQRIKTMNGDICWAASHHIIEIKNICRPRRIISPFLRHRPATDLEDGTAPVFGNLMRAYTPVWSFILNQTIIALSTALGFEVRLSSTVSDFTGFFVVYGVTFLSGLGIMLLFFSLFGFGEAMLAPKRPKVMSRQLAIQLFGNMRIEENEALIMTESNQIYGPRLNFNYVSKIYLEPRTKRPA